MGAPVVRRDELEAAVKQLRSEARKAAAAGRKKANDPDGAFVTRAELRAEFVEFAKMLGIAPATPDLTEQLADAEGQELVAAIHERKQESTEQLPEAEAVEADVERDAALFETDGEDS